MESKHRRGVKNIKIFALRNFIDKCQNKCLKKTNFIMINLKLETNKTDQIPNSRFLISKI